MVTMASKRGEPIPRVNYERRNIQIIKRFNDLKENEVEVTIKRVLELGELASTSCYLFVEFPYPREKPQQMKSNYFKGEKEPNLKIVQKVKFSGYTFSGNQSFSGNCQIDCFKIIFSKKSILNLLSDDNKSKSYHLQTSSQKQINQSVPGSKGWHFQLRKSARNGASSISQFGNEMSISLGGDSHGRVSSFYF